MGLMTVIAQKTARKLNLWKVPVLGPLTYMAWKFDAARKFRWMKSYIPFIGAHIEIGSGPGSVLDVMRPMTRRCCRQLCTIHAILMSSLLRQRGLRGG